MVIYHDPPSCAACHAGPLLLPYRLRRCHRRHCGRRGRRRRRAIVVIVVVAIVVIVISHRAAVYRAVAVAIVVGPRHRCRRRCRCPSHRCHHRRLCCLSRRCHHPRICCPSRSCHRRCCHRCPLPSLLSSYPVAPSPVALLPSLSSSSSSPVAIVVVVFCSWEHPQSVWHDLLGLGRRRQW